MSIQLSANSFLQMVSHSGLLSDEQLRTVEQQFFADPDSSSAQQISDWLLTQRLITTWQAEKLLQARFRGFFLGPYRLLDRVARGGMSTIYAARHQTSGEIHALKVLPLTRTSHPAYLSRFQREAEITQRLQHPHIVKVFGVFADSDGQAAVHFMAMELLQGRDLSHVIHTEGRLPWKEATEYIRQAATGLAYAHQLGLVHRDIKPGNLFLTEDRSVRILDLGLAQDFDSEESLTRDFNERVIGTADYLAPEQATDSHTVDGRADVYSLGCTFYFLLTGQPPFTEGTLIQRLMSHQTKKPLPVSDFRQDVPQELIEILNRMMEKDRNLRIASASDVALELHDLLTRLEERPTIRDVVGFSPTASDLPGVMPAIAIANESTEILPCPLTSPLSEKGAEYSDDVPWFPFESEPEPSAPADFLPAFSDMLQTIQSQCDSAGAFAADPRRPALLETVQRLMQQPSDFLISAVPSLPEHPVVIQTDTPPAATANQGQNVGNRRTLTYLHGACLILLLIAIAAAMIAWDRWI